jgi:hypothetical protein
MPSDKDLLKAALLNNDGYMALRDGRVAESLELFRLSALECRRIGDVEGEVLALENTYLALRAGRRYPEALDAIIALVAPMFRARLYPKVHQYWVEISQAILTLAEMNDPYVVREDRRDEDVGRGVAELGVEPLQRRGLLLVSADQDVLEVLGHFPRSDRVRFLERFTSEVTARTSALGRNLAELVQEAEQER